MSAADTLRNAILQITIETVVIQGALQARVVPSIVVTDPALSLVNTSWGLLGSRRYEFTLTADAVTFHKIEGRHAARGKPCVVFARQSVLVTSLALILAIDELVCKTVALLGLRIIFRECWLANPALLVVAARPAAYRT